jgi:cell surface protein SprA
VNADLDFEKLYNYSKYLKSINSNPRGGQQPRNRDNRRNRRNQDNDPGTQDQQNDRRDRNNTGGRNDVDPATGQPAKDKKKKDGQPSGAERAIIRPLMVLRKARFNYQETYGTVVPGYLPGSKLLGMNNFKSPGWDFIAGLQPNIRQEDYYTPNDWLYNNWNWITGDQLLNQPVTQTYQQSIDGKLTLEPFSDFRIDVEASRSKSKNHSEYFRRNEILVDPDQRFQEEFEHLIPRDVGSYTISYSALKTLFNDDVTGLFETFETNRVVIANRLNQPPGSHSNPDNASGGYPEGYGPSQQNVLIPSFLAAYTGKDANTVKVSRNYVDDVLIKTLPRPNWRLTYNGLSKLAPFSEVFQSFTLSHGYKGTLTVNSFETNLQFNQNDPLREDQINLDYFSRFEVPDIRIQEQFSPLLGVDVRLKNEMSFKVEYKTSRTLNMNLAQGALHETKGEDLTLGFGYKIKNMKLSFLTPKKKKRSKKPTPETPPQNQGRQQGGRGQAQAGDFDITFDFSLREDQTLLHSLNDQLEEPTRGNRTISFLPQATYQINRQLSLRFFFDYRRNVPKTSQGYPTTNVRSGVTVRFSLN